MASRVWLVLGLTGILLFAGCVDPGTSTGKDSGSGKKSAGGKGAQGAIPTLPNYTAMRLDGTLLSPGELGAIGTLAGLQRFLPVPTSEPTLGVNKKGTVYMNGFNGASQVFLTTNQGLTWKEITNKAAGQTLPPQSLDPFIHVDPDTGRVFNADLYVACLFLAWTDDDGGSWTTNPLGCGLPPGVHDHQSIYTGKPRATPTVGYPNMLYYCVNRIGDTSCASSNNGGLSFGPLLPVMLGVDVERGAFCGGLNAHVKTDREGRVFVPKAQCGIPTVGVSEDDGRTWNAYKISSVGTYQGDHEVAIATDDANNVYALWIGDTGLPQFSMSKDHGKTWSPAKVVSPPSVTMADKPAIAASAGGKVAFGYIGATTEGGYKNRPTGCTGGGFGQQPDCSKRNAAWANTSWNGYLGVIEDTLADNPVVLTTTVNAPSEPIAVHVCGGTRCIPLYDFIDVEIDSQGRPWVALTDMCQATCTEAFHKEPGSARHDKNIGFAGTLAEGPALTKEGGRLPPLSTVSAVPAPAKG